MPRRVMQGQVVSDKGEKTVIVMVERKVMHPLYKKYVKRSKRFAAHDEANTYKVGDLVQIEECPRVSKTKAWRVIGTVGADTAPAEA